MGWNMASLKVTWVNYNDSLIWIVRPWKGMISIEIYIYIYLKRKHDFRGWENRVRSLFHLPRGFSTLRVPFLGCTSNLGVLPRPKALCWDGFSAWDWMKTSEITWNDHISWQTTSCVAWENLRTISVFSQLMLTKSVVQLDICSHTLLLHWNINHYW